MLQERCQVHLARVANKRPETLCLLGNCTQAIVPERESLGSGVNSTTRRKFRAEGKRKGWKWSCLLPTLLQMQRPTGGFGLLSTFENPEDYPITDSQLRSINPFDRRSVPRELLYRACYLPGFLFSLPRRNLQHESFFLAVERNQAG
jgi:hypothetical protein